MYNKLYLSILLLFGLNSTSFSQPLPKSRFDSHYTYLYQLNYEQARQLYQTHGQLDIQDLSLYHTLVDSFQTDSSYLNQLPPGYYLSVSAKSNKLEVGFLPVHRLDIKMLNNQTDLNFLVHDEQGNLMKAAEVVLGKKKISFDPTTQSYKLRKTQKEGLLTISYQGHTDFYYIEKAKNNSWFKRTSKGILYGVPLRYIWLPPVGFVRSITRSIRWGSPQGWLRPIWAIFTDDYRRYSDKSGNYKGYITFNKPKYLPGDTVKLKFYLAKKSGRAIKKPLDVFVKPSYNKKVNLGSVKPYQKGGYAFEFILHDSLGLKLDRSYSIEVKRKKQQLLSGWFKFEDYELEDYTLKTRLLKKEHHQGEKQALMVKAEDSNRMNILDGRVRLLVRPESIYRFHQDHVFVPDTLWAFEQKLEAVGETKIALVDSLFHDISARYQVEVQSLNGNNEMYTQRLNAEFKHETPPLKLSLEADSLQVNLSEAIRKGMVKGYGREGQLLFQQQVKQKAGLKVSPFVSEYLLSADSLEERLTLRSETPLLNCYTNRTRDSVHITMDNPRKLPFWYSIYRGNSLVQEGMDSSLHFSCKAKPAERYFISYQYLWNGKTEEKNYSIPYGDKGLNIEVKQKQVVSPGEEVKVHLKVTDERNKPVPKTDVTALAYSAKFKSEQSTGLPVWKKEQKGRTYINEFHKRKNPWLQKDWTDTLNYDAWRLRMGLDTLAFYRFLYPDSGLYTQYIPSQDSIAQVSPFVSQHGRLLHSYLVYIDDELVYFSEVDGPNPYAFEMDTGYHTIKIRTFDQLVEMKKVYLKPSHKLVLNLDLNAPLPPGFGVWQKETQLETHEVKRLNNSLLKIRHKRSDKRSYFQQGDRIYELPHPLPSDSSPKSYLVGPFKARNLKYSRGSQFETEFVFEPNFEYEIDKNRIRQRYSKDIISKPYPLRNKEMYPRIYDWVKRIQNPRPYSPTVLISHLVNTAPDLTFPKKTGKLKVQFTNLTMPKIEKILLFKEGDPVVYLNNRYNREWKKINEGTYQMLLLLDSNRYYYQKDIHIQANGLNFYRFHPQDWQSIDITQWLALSSDSIVTAACSPEGLVQGYVTDTVNKPVLGAYVSLKGERQGVYTGPLGKFSIVAKPGDTLYVQSQEMAPVILPVVDQQVKRIRMKRLSSMVLKEVIVMGYAAKERRSLTSSISTSGGSGKNQEVASENAQGLMRRFSGKVMDKHMEIGLPGVNVLVKGTDIGTVTDMDGAYSIEAPIGSTLYFSYVGFKPLELMTSGGIPSTIMMEEDSHNLEEVVVTGYSVSGALQGGAAGVQVESTTAPRILIRGSSSLVASSTPLVIVDGVLTELSLDDLSPDQIHSMDILQGAQATALYGSKASGGVVIVTTGKAVGKIAEDGSMVTPRESQQNSLRSNFSDYAYWQPSLTTDRQGEVEFTTTFPDDIGGWDTQVLAIRGKRTGQVSGLVKSFKSVVATLAVPRFAIEGDSVAMIGKTLNYTEDSFDIQTEFEINGKPVFRNEKLLVNSEIDSCMHGVNGRDSVQVKYTMQKDGGYFDGELRKVPVYPQGVKETVGNFLVLQTDTVLNLILPYEEVSTQLYLQSSALEVMLNELEHIQEYPYACNEQTASKLMAYLLEKEIRESLQQPFLHEKQIEKLLKRLIDAQKENGSWGWWPASSESLRMTTYVASVLLKARETGYLPESALYTTTDYLQENLNNIRRTNKLNTLSILAKLNAPVYFEKHLDELATDTTLTLTEYLQLQLLRKQHHLPYEVDTLKSLKKETLMGGLYFGEENFHWDANAVHTTLWAYQLLKGEEGYESYLNKMAMYFLEKRNGGYWRNTFESAKILATLLPGYMKGKKIEHHQNSVRLTGNIEEEITEFPYALKIPAGQKVQLVKKGDLPIFLQYSQSFWNNTPDPNKEYFDISSLFENNQDSVVNLEAGKVINLQVKVKVKKKAEYVMIEVPIPAGCTYDRKERGWGYKEVHREYFKEKVAIFCESLSPGEYTFEVPLQSRFKGVYHLNPAKAELMYFPVFYGRNGMKKVHLK
ncbi:carboxypeptidase-like regulatory domain-containing protein [Rapidithrix thailandica]|uniref:Carboxypeptidase-like regulatory domain-containing protein n=1 Tax=Rapidithrix thailandica TaxID=413964 RepID=A0AAW9S9R7_9BACT